MASVRKLPSGRYRVRWRDPDGRERGETFRTHREAQARRAAVEVEVSRGHSPDPGLGKQALSTFLDSVLDGDRSLSPATRARYETQARVHIRPRLGNRRLRSIRPADLRRLYGDLEAEGAGGPTIRAVHNLMSKVLGEAYRDGILGDNPASRVRPPRFDRKPIRIPTPVQVEAIVSKMDTRYRALVLTAAYGGLRFGELAGLQVKHLDADLRTVRVEQAATDVGGQVRIGPPKTKLSVRSVKLPGFVVERIACAVGHWGFDHADHFRGHERWDGPHDRPYYRDRAVEGDLWTIFARAVGGSRSG